MALIMGMELIITEKRTKAHVETEKHQREASGHLRPCEGSSVQGKRRQRSE